MIDHPRKRMHRLTGRDTALLRLIRLIGLSYTESRRTDADEALK
jgi:hypothetical protein